MEESKCAFISRGMSSIEIFYLRFIAKIKLVIQILHFCKLISHPFIRFYQVIMASFYHKRSRKNQVSHFCITEGASHIEIRHFPFKTFHETVWIMSVHY